MAPIRLRHPKGITTLQVDFDTFTVLDLQQEIYKATEIMPSQQDLKAGYPPHSLTLIPELPLESLGLKQGEQLIVAQKVGPALQPRSPTTSRSLPPSAGNTAPRTSAVRSPTSPAPPRRTTDPDPYNALLGVQAQPASSSGPDYVQTDAGYLVHRIVPDDNSCLFSSIALIFEQDQTKAPKIRKIVADEIQKDMVTWSAAILGRPREEYIATILKPTSWGGAIELSVLSTYYNTEICSVDVETGRIDTFSPNPQTDSPPLPSENRAILIYSGIHYDAATVAPILDAPPDFHQTLIPIQDEGVLEAAKKLATKLRAKKAYTNTATFDLKCLVCKKGLKGEKEARAHASETGHTEFGEY